MSSQGKIAIIGAGFCGLASAWNLAKRGFSVTLFDKKGIGAGASGIATGLLHPYPGEKGRRSWMADEALLATNQLLSVAEKALGVPVASRTGILKIGLCSGAGTDVEQWSPHQFLIHSGLTVYVDLYLDGLWQVCRALGVQLQIAEIDSLDGLKEFDAVVLAAGAGIFDLTDCTPLKLKPVKGQVLTCTWPETEPPLERSVIAKRYLTLDRSPLKCHIGATYEHHYSSPDPCLKTATAYLQPDLKILSCQAAIRVTNPTQHHRPILQWLSDRCIAITAMGSRGLLYHAYFAEKLARSLSSEFIL